LQKVAKFFGTEKDGGKRLETGHILLYPKEDSDNLCFRAQNQFANLNFFPEDFRHSANLTFKLLPILTHFA
jgi:hypothetical protein